MREPGEWYITGSGESEKSPTNLYGVKECWNGLQTETKAVCGGGGADEQWAKSDEPSSWHDDSACLSVTYSL